MDGTTFIKLGWIISSLLLTCDAINAQDTYTVEDLRSDLQTALELEHLIIPPYMTALATIMKDNNSDVYHQLKDVLVQEMFHMALVSNILNAVGGKPSTNFPAFIPKYPSALPGGVHPDLIVPIKRFSLDLVKDVFLTFEQPEIEESTLRHFKHVFTFVRRLKDRLGHCQRSGATGQDCESPENILTWSGPSGCFISNDRTEFLTDFKNREWLKVLRREAKKHGISPTAVIHHKHTVGGFYRHILHGLGHLTDCGTNNSIFTGEMSKQIQHRKWTVRVPGRMQNMTVTDYISAADAIEFIIEEGEGSSPCNPDSHSEEGKKDLSH